MAFKKLTNEG